MDVTSLLISIGEIVFKLLPGIEQYGPQIFIDFQQDWEALIMLRQNGGKPTQEQHDRMMANLERGHALFQANTADVDSGQD